MSLNDGKLPRARIIAFATHALIGGELIGLREPALVLTPPKHPSEEDNGLLTIDDILRLKLDRNEWVILSACNTVAADGSGEGLSGLARAFFYAGAPSLLVFAIECRR
jgi:CHAT domain-containing protein